MNNLKAEKTGSERREFTRVKVDLLVRLKVEDDWFESDRVRDLSLNGLLLDFDEDFDFPPQTHVKAQIIIGGVGANVRVDILGQAIRTGGGLVAVEITEIYGPEGLEHMKNLVLYNCADAEKVNEEFEHHLGIKPVSD